ncbi:hypothetical protein NDA01_07150 [Trichocoleus desertorum AS-A10]|uniref:hypothetical protein n=1 Tax=Trichocoleus desertorum TaxID=1481672 RepID=UPI003298F690
MRHPDDQPQPLGPTDWMLAKELGAVISTQQRFYQSCDGALRALLSLSEWGIVQEANDVTVLLVMCPTIVVTDRLLKRCTSLANKLLKVADTPAHLHIQGPDCWFRCPADILRGQ